MLGRVIFCVVPNAMNSLVLRYALFAALSMGVNLGAQSLVFMLLPKAWNLWPGVLVGTGMGLVTKYILPS